MTRVLDDFQVPEAVLYSSLGCDLTACSLWGTQQEKNPYRLAHFFDVILKALVTCRITA